MTPAHPAPAGARASLPPALSRRGFLQAAATAGAVALAGPAAAATRPAAGTTTTLTFTTATNGAAALAPAGDRIVAEIQGVLWSVPRDGGPATALTDPELEPTRPHWSPDGSALAFSAYHDGVHHIWTVRPDGTGLRRLTDGPFDDRAPSWSPDGTRIAFCSERGGDITDRAPYRVWTLDVRSGALTRLTGNPGQEGPYQSGDWEDFDPAWSPDGQRVLFVRAPATAPGELRARTIASVRADGTGPVGTEHTDPAEGQIMAPAVSPAGRIAYLRTTPAPSASCTLVVDGAPVPIPGDVHPAPVRWTTDDTLLLTVDGTFRILRPDAPHDARTIPFTAALPVTRPRYRDKRYDFDDGGRHRVRGLHQPALSPDGRHVAFAALNSLWTAPVHGRERPRRVLAAPPTGYLLAPSWTPDGRSLIYADDRDGSFTVRRRDLRSGRETVLATGGRVFPALSPDGHRLAALTMAGDLTVRDLGTGEERVLAPPLTGGGLPGPPSWSPDGRHIALCDRNRLNNRFREGHHLIRVIDTRDGGSALHSIAPHASLSDRYASGPVWSPDGRWMAVIAESALWLLPVRPDGTPDGPARRLTREAADHPSWSADSRTLLYLSGGSLRLIAAEGGDPVDIPVRLHHTRPRAADIVVHAGRLWDGTGEHVERDVDIIVRDGRVAAVERHRAGRRAERHLDASARTVVPGLWDAHVHPWQSTYGGRQTALQLAYGITTNVSLGGFAHEQARIREAVAAGELVGPRLLTTGELLDGARVAYSMGRAHRTPEGLRRSLSRAADLDWDFVKTYVRAPYWIMREAADFAHQRLGVRAGSHFCSPGVQSGQDLTTHLQATNRRESGTATSATGRVGQDVTEIYTATDFHLVATPFTALPLLGADPGLADDPRVTALMPAWDTDLVRERAGRPPTAGELATLDTETAVYRRILERGALVALGTDQPLVPVGLHLHLGLRALHRAGLTPAAALRTATAIPARVFGADADLGTLEPGKLADLTVVDGDPFTDFASLTRTVTAVRGGHVHHRDDLVRAFTEEGGRAGTGPALPGTAGPEHWHEVAERMRRDGCCVP
ncbi:amidohydrolase family protein [Streptomyces marincola]|uniref:amidohydrolase family protein n=1 Tax=Streptomyces marincola TaxID=2878388 RepID=UPI001CF4744D|nr:amidohydrolase family protein [Streptomyces marincola]UCM86464.1 amidohydrolase family protein [Streptomyces marincola]